MLSRSIPPLIIVCIFESQSNFVQFSELFVLSIFGITSDILQSHHCRTCHMVANSTIQVGLNLNLNLKPTHYIISFSLTIRLKLADQFAFNQNPNCT